MSAPEHNHMERARRCPVGVIAFGGRILCYSVAPDSATQVHELGGSAPLALTPELKAAIAADVGHQGGKGG